MDSEMTELFQAIDRALSAEAEGDSSATDQARKRLEVDGTLDRLCEVYLETGTDGRSAIRDFIASRRDQDMWLMNVCAHWLADRVQGSEAARWLRLALAAVSIDDCGLDYRDTSLLMSKIFERAEQAGLNPRPDFEDMAERSTNRRTPGGCDSVAKGFRAWARKA